MSEDLCGEQLRQEEMLVLSQIEADKLAEQAEEDSKVNQLIDSYEHEVPASVIDAKVVKMEPKLQVPKDAKVMEFVENAMVALEERDQKIMK